MAARREAVLDAAVHELVESGVADATMAAIARRAGASKETLYSWFGNREGLLAAVIRRNADAAAARVHAALDDPTDPETTLASFGAGLLTMLTGPGSLAINRAAMTDPPLAAELLASGRHRVGPIVERYLAATVERGVLRIDDVAEAFEVFYGLLIRDTQIRCLLGEAPPTPDVVRRRADDAARTLVTMYRI